MFRTKLVDFLARFLISAIFINAIPNKLLNFDDNIDFIMQRGINESIAIILLINAILCLSLGSFFLLFGKSQRLGSVLLLIFLIPTTIIFHLFPLELYRLVANLGFTGGLLLIMARDPRIDKKN